MNPWEVPLPAHTVFTFRTYTVCQSRNRLFTMNQPTVPICSSCRYPFFSTDILQVRINQPESEGRDGLQNRVFCCTLNLQSRLDPSISHNGTMAKATLFTEANDLARSGNCWLVRLLLEQWRDTVDFCRFVCFDFVASSRMEQVIQSGKTGRVSRLCYFSDLLSNICMIRTLSANHNQDP